MPTFHFPDPGSIPHFCSGIPPHRLSLIKRLELDWEGAFSIFNPDETSPRFDGDEMDAWLTAWACIAQMQNLKELRVRLKKHRYLHLRNALAMESRQLSMCEPMMQIRIPGLRVFELEVEWNEAVLRRQLGILLNEGEVPFVIKQVSLIERRRMSIGSISTSSTWTTNMIP
jgi:hypothetical protein